MRRLSWLVVPLVGFAMLAGCSSRAEFFAGTFEECGRDRDCVYYPDDLCYTVQNAGVRTGMCTYDCFDDFDCPAFSVCEDIDGPWICYEECFDDFDCAPGFACFYDPVGDVDVCLAY
jgi:hypothetical protein